LDGNQPQAAIRLGRALTLARAGDHARAASEVGELSTLAGPDGNLLLAGARALALASLAARTDAKLSTEERQTLADHYASQAIDWLRRSFQADPPSGPGIVKDLRRQTDWEPLRQRADFQALIAELSFPADPFAR